MLPLNRATLSDDQAVFKAPEADDSRRLVSYETAGIALNDGSAGREVQVWTARIDGHSVLISAPSHPESLLFSVAGALTAVSLAFDSNMQPVVVFREDGLYKLRYWNSTSGSFAVMPLAGATSAKAGIDDHRGANSDLSDVIVGYVRGGMLYWRQQRDRYLVEYTAGPAFGMDLARMGMTNGLRFAFELRIGG